MSRTYIVKTIRGGQLGERVFSPPITETKPQPNRESLPWQPFVPSNELGWTLPLGTINSVLTSGNNNPNTNPNTAQTIGNTISGQLKFDQVIALISQGIGAWGKNPTTQVSGLTVRTVAPQQQQQPYYPTGTAGFSPEQIAAAQLAAAQQNSAGGALGSGLDGIVSWATANPIIVFAGIAGVYLLMR